MNICKCGCPYVDRAKHNLIFHSEETEWDKI